MDDEERAARHAALGDVTRLRIVDALVDGDRSPGDLRDVLGLGSNLLAHHLGVLERVGLVRRRRSEADRRRAYVQLVPSALPGPSPVAPEWHDVRRVVFVCTANSARSKLAEALWNAHRGQGPVATSAGTHPADRVQPRAEQVARRRGLRITGPPVHLPDPLAGAMRDSVVVTVCDRAHEELERERPDAARRVHWSVPDPVRAGSAAAFETAADELESRIVRVIAPASR